MFSALLLRKENGQQSSQIKLLDESELPSGDVLVDVAYSSINYKDGLAITGKGKIIRNFPMVPGIDLAGTVLHSDSPDYQVGDTVIATGWGIGENHWGGLSQRARLNSEWLTPLPQGMSFEQAMTIGTAGFTAMLCVDALLTHGVKPEQGEVLVTGASGGVGSTAIVLLSQLGFDVVAISGREQNHAYLEQLGAKRVLARKEFEQQGRPLEKQCWAAAVDAAGSHVLANVLAQINYGGAVAACGLAAGFELSTTVMPFILRNVALLGIDSVSVPKERRPAIWQQLVELLPASYYDACGITIPLSEVETYAQRIVRGQVTGRTLVKL